MTGQTQAVDLAILTLRDQGRMDEALAQLFDHYEARVYRLCRAFLRDDTWAEDVAQQSLIRIWKGLPGFDGRAALSTWIYSITRNRCNTALGGRRGDEFGDEVLEQLADEQVMDPLRADAASVVARLVAALPDKYRVPMTLYYFEDESVTEVAERLGCPIGTVKTNLSRARTQLRAELDRLGLGEWTLWN
jgi:RNA polymerase sigma-70 factor (ECF subfamily)